MYVISTYDPDSFAARTQLDTWWHLCPLRSRVSRQLSLRRPSRFSVAFSPFLTIRAIVAPWPPWRMCGVHTIHPRGRFLIASMGIPSRFARTSIVLGLIRANHWFDFANLNPERPDARSNANGRVVRGLRRRRAVVGTWRRGWSAGALLDRYKGRVGAVTAVRRHWTRQAEHGVPY